MPSLSRRTDEHQARRAAVEASLLERTERLLAEGRPFSELSVGEITEAAGISRTAFYFYFADKRELLMRLTEEVTAKLFTEAERWWGDESAGAEAIASALARIVALYGEHVVLLRAVVEAAAVDEPVATFWRSLIGRFADATQARIEDEQAAGTARPGPARATAFALVWMTERTLYQRQAQEPFDEDELGSALSTIWIGVVYGEDAPG